MVESHRQLGEIFPGAKKKYLSVKLPSCLDAEATSELAYLIVAEKLQSGTSSQLWF